MNDFTKVRTILGPLYDNASFPVIFVTDKLDRIYSNDFASREFPELCEGQGIKRFICPMYIQEISEKLHSGKPAGISGLGIRGFSSASFIPIGGILNGKCAIMHVEQPKELLESMYAEAADITLADRSAETFENPVRCMRGLIEKLEQREDLMSDPMFRVAMSRMTDCVQEFSSYVRDYTYALRLVSKTSEPNHSTFRLKDYFITYCKMHAGLTCAENCDDSVFIVCNGKELDEMLDAAVSYVFSAAPADSARAKVRVKGEDVTFIFSARRRGIPVVEFAPDGRIQSRLEKANSVALRYGGSAEATEKKGILTVTVKMTSALGTEAGSYLHNRTENISYSS